MKYMSVMIKPASGLCNMSCRYCFYCDEAKKRETAAYGMMSETTLKNVIRKTIPHATHGITYLFQGGEPTLRGIGFYEQCVRYVTRYNRSKIPVQFAFQTNGLLLDEKWCEFFFRNRFLVGVSIDGTKEIHDTCRPDISGSGTYGRILENIRLLDRFQVDYNILTVVTRKLAEQIEDVYTAYQKQGFHYQQYIACLDPLGEGHGKTPDALTPELYGSFLIRLFALWYSDYKKGRQPYIRSFENYIGILAGHPAEACDQRGTCGIQHVVEADGSIYPCDFYMLDSFCLGNFNENRFDEIIGKRESLKFISESKKLEETCLNCRYYKLCRGGCMRHRDLSEKTGLYSNYFCGSYQMFFDTCYTQMKSIADRLL